MGAWDTKERIKMTIQREEQRQAMTEDALQAEIDENFVNYSQILSCRTRLNQVCQQLKFNTRDFEDMQFDIVKEFGKIKEIHSRYRSEEQQMKLKEDNKDLFECISELQTNNVLRDLNVQQIQYISSLLQKARLIIKQTKDPSLEA